MGNCDLFVNFLKGNKSLNYDDFKHLTVEYFSEYITKLYKNYNCKFIISNDFPVYGRCIGVEKIIINEDIIKKIYNGAIGSLLIIFHEISHLLIPVASAYSISPLNSSKAASTASLFPAQGASFALTYS